MITTKNSKPMSKVGQVYETTNYDQFKTLSGNRPANTLHIKRLIASMSEEYLLSPILVNGDYSIIDGQHRFEAAKFLDLPIRFIKVGGYGLEQVQRLNSNMSNWSHEDFMNGYCELGMDEYVTYRDFKKRHKFSHTICQQLLSGSIDHGKEKAPSAMFKLGTFKCVNLVMAERIAADLSIIGQYYETYRDRYFVRALLRVYRDIEEFDIARLISQLEKYPSKLKPQVSTDAAIENIEGLYNYHKHKKLNLRF